MKYRKRRSLEDTNQENTLQKSHLLGSKWSQENYEFQDSLGNNITELIISPLKK